MRVDLQGDKSVGSWRGFIVAFVVSNERPGLRSNGKLNDLFGFTLLIIYGGTLVLQGVYFKKHYIFFAEIQAMPFFACYVIIKYKILCFRGICSTVMQPSAAA